MGWGGRWKRRSEPGDTCTRTADSCQCMEKPPQYCEVISLQLKLIKKKKQRPYFTNKGLVKAMVFPVVMYGCESWTYKES